MAGKNKSWYLGRCGIGVGTGLAALTLSCMLFALLTVKGIVPEAWAEKCATLCVFLSSYCACTMSARGTVKHAAMTAATAVAFLLALLLLGLVGFDSLSGSRILCHAIAAALGAALSLMKRAKGRGSKHKSIGEHKARKRIRR